jgi:5-methylphenazine-1-carboxylate 1-monooxygenase
VRAASKGVHAAATAGGTAAPTVASVKVIVVGGGIGGLAAALMLGERHIECRVYEQAPAIRELGVGINVLPNAVRELGRVALLGALCARGIATHELIYLNHLGQEVWREPRGLDAGHDVPQVSIHRGALQRVILDAVLERSGRATITTGRRLAAFAQDGGGVTAHFVDRDGRAVETVRGDVLIGADGIHSTVRAALFADEGPPRWNGVMMWRGAIEWPSFLTGRSMIIAGTATEKVVVYPIARCRSPEHRLTNWVALARTGDPSTPPPRREDWARTGRMADVAAVVSQFALKQVDIAGLATSTVEFFEYPMCDRDPLPRWSHGRVTLLGDAAHPMYPVGSNGATQAILDARALADALSATRDPVAALRRYEEDRRPLTTGIVHANRAGGPEAVIEAVAKLAPDGFRDVDEVLPYAEREAIVRRYARTSGSALTTVDRA